jgi:hypothetical protein
MLVQRILTATMATMAVLAVAGAASAVPSISLSWTATTGTGTTGGSSIDASAGDVLRLLISVSDPTGGLSFAGVSLVWDAGDLVGAVPGVNGVGGFGECPAPENAVTAAFNAPNCSNNGAFGPALTPFAPGVVVGAGSASSFDAGGTTPLGAPATIFVGAIEFTVGGSATSETISIAYSPGLDSVNDAAGGVFFPDASASLVVPEPGTAALMGLGLGTLGFLGRRRS